MSIQQAREAAEGLFVRWCYDTADELEESGHLSAANAEDLRDHADHIRTGVPRLNFDVRVKMSGQEELEYVGTITGFLPALQHLLKYFGPAETFTIERVIGKEVDVRVADIVIGNIQPAPQQ